MPSAYRGSVKNVSRSIVLETATNVRSQILEFAVPDYLLNRTSEIFLLVNHEQCILARLPLRRYFIWNEDHVIGSNLPLQ